MRFIRTLFLIASLPAIFYSCQKEESIELDSVPVSGTRWEFKDSSLLFTGTMDSASSITIGNFQSLIIEGKSSDGLSELYIQILSPDNIRKGSYSNPAVIFDYSVSGVSNYVNVPTDVNKFTVTITRIDSAFVEGTFSGEVQDVLGNKRIVKDGKFKASFKGNSVNPPPPSGSGQLTVWSKKGCNGGPVTVKVQNQQGSITTFHPSEPACNASGTATFTLPQGQYTWEAICGTDTMRSSTGISAGSCIRVEVIFGPVTSGANCMINEFSAFDPVTNDFYQSVKSTFNSLKQVTQVQLFDSVAGSASTTFNLNYTPGRIKIDAQQFFLVDIGSGRVKSFEGFLEPDDPTTPKVIVTYTYDNSGRLTRAAFASALNPGTTVFESVHTWTNGNLSRVILRQPGAVNERTQIDYDYHLDKNPKNFLVFFANSELLYFQSAINTGLNSTNAVKKSTVKSYDAAGVLEDSEESDFEDYVLDSNKYVQNFTIENGDSVYGGDLKYALKYKCF